MKFFYIKRSEGNIARNSAYEAKLYFFGIPLISRLQIGGGQKGKSCILL
ncbi:hypothetical protein [Helicobacter sp. 23-1045]